MAYLFRNVLAQPLTEEDRLAAGPGEAPAPAPAAPSPGAAPSTPTALPSVKGSTFPDLTAYLRGNRDAATGMGDKVIGEKFSDKRMSGAIGELTTPRGQLPPPITIDLGNNTRTDVPPPSSAEGVVKAQADLENTKTDEGRQTLLSDVYGKPQTEGGGRLDSYLLGQTTGGKFEEARNKWGPLLENARAKPAPTPGDPLRPVEPKKPDPTQYGYGGGQPTYDQNAMRRYYQEMEQYRRDLDAWERRYGGKS